MRPRLFRISSKGPESLPQGWLFRRTAFQSEAFEGTQPKYHVLAEQDRYMLTGLCEYSHEFMLHEAYVVDDLKDTSLICRRCLRLQAQSST